MCFVWIWEQTAIISLYSINWLLFKTKGEYIFCAVRTEYLNIIQVMCFVWIWEQTAIISLYSINWLVFKTKGEYIYCAVRTEYLNIIQVNACLAVFTHAVYVFVTSYFVAPSTLFLNGRNRHPEPAGDRKCAEMTANYDVRRWICNITWQWAIWRICHPPNYLFRNTCCKFTKTISFFWATV